MNGNYLGAARHRPVRTSTFSCRTYVVIDYNLVELVGIDFGSKLAKIGPGPLIIISERRSLSANVGGVDTVLTPVAANRPDAFGVLDASACPSAGARRGFRTLGTCYARFLGGPPMMGVLSSAGGGMTDNWSETTKLTIEWMFKVNGGSVIPARAPLFGLGGQDARDYQPVPCDDQQGTWRQDHDRLPHQRCPAGRDDRTDYVSERVVRDRVRFRAVQDCGPDRLDNAVICCIR